MNVKYFFATSFFLLNILIGKGNIIKFTKKLELPNSQNYKICKYDTLIDKTHTQYLLDCECHGGKQNTFFHRKINFSAPLVNSYINFPLIGKVYFFDCIPNFDELRLENDTLIKFKPDQLANYISGFCQNTDYKKFIINTSKKVCSVSGNLKKDQKYKSDTSLIEFDSSIGVEISSSVINNTATINFIYYTGQDLKEIFYE